MAVSEPWVLPHEQTNTGIHNATHGTRDKSWMMVWIRNAFILGSILRWRRAWRTDLRRGKCFWQWYVIKDLTDWCLQWFSIKKHKIKIFKFLKEHFIMPPPTSTIEKCNTKLVTFHGPPTYMGALNPWRETQIMFVVYIFLYTRVKPNLLKVNPHLLEFGYHKLRQTQWITIDDAQQQSPVITIKCNYKMVRF